MDFKDMNEANAVTVWRLINYDAVAVFIIIMLSSYNMKWEVCLIEEKQVKGVSACSLH